MRDAVLRFYFQLAFDYSMYRFLPHTAILIWDAHRNSVRSHQPRDVAGACFLLAQVLVDTVALSVEDMARACSTTRRLLLCAEDALASLVLVDTTFCVIHPEQTLVPLRHSLPPDVWETVMDCFDHAFYVDGVSTEERAAASRIAAFEVHSIRLEGGVKSEEKRLASRILDASGRPHAASRLIGTGDPSLAHSPASRVPLREQSN